MKFAIKPIRRYGAHLRHVATLLAKLKIQIFGSIKQIWKIKLQSNCILIAPILIQLRLELCVLSVFMC